MFSGCYFVFSSSVLFLCAVRTWIERWTTRGSRSSLVCRRSEHWSRESTNSEMRRSHWTQYCNNFHFSHLSTSLVPQLKLQERLQEKQGLLTKKEELAAVIQKDERDIKVQAGDIVGSTTTRSCVWSVAGRCRDSAVDQWQRSCGARRRQRGSCARRGTRPRHSARQRWTLSGAEWTPSPP